MADAMRKKVAAAMFRQDHDEGWDQGEDRTKGIYLNNADAALEACCYEELVEALQNCRSLVELHYGGTDHTGHAAIAQANAVLAKVEEETVDFGDEGHA